MTRNIAIIQARMGASRLPGKVLLPLGDSCLLDYSVRRCRQIDGVNEVIVATTTSDADDAIEAWCRNAGIAVFRGPEDDVLTRYLSAAEPYNPAYMIRVTADNPFVDYGLAESMLRHCEQAGADLARLQGTCPLGLAAEAVSYAALRIIGERGKEARHREHVTYYAYEYPEQFASVEVPVPGYMHGAAYRLTVDTSLDYQLCASIAEAFRGNPTVASSTVIQYLHDHPELALTNASVMQKPVV